MDTVNVTDHCGHLRPYMMHVTLIRCGTAPGTFRCSLGPHRRRKKELVTALMARWAQTFYRLKRCGGPVIGAQSSAKSASREARR